MVIQKKCSGAERFLAGCQSTMKDGKRKTAKKTMNNRQTEGNNALADGIDTRMSKYPNILLKIIKINVFIKYFQDIFMSIQIRHFPPYLSLCKEIVSNSAGFKQSVSVS